MYLSKLESSNINISKSLLLSKYIHLNTYAFPKLIQFKLIFPMFDSVNFNKSKLLIIILKFLEEITGCKAFISSAKIFAKNGIFFKCQVNLNKFLFKNFIFFLNEYILITNLLKYSSKKAKLSKFNNQIISLFLFDIDVFFDAYTRRLLPSKKSFWLEFNFIFNKNYKLLNNLDILFYTQLFFSHNIFNF